jgi:hypothetical protein
VNAMTDDIVTRLREYNPVRGFIDWHDTMTTAADEIERLRADCDKWRNMANRLGTHMGEGLYTDDWEAREYAISAYYEWQSHPEAKLYAYDKPAEPVWYFKGGAL